MKIMLNESIKLDFYSKCHKKKKKQSKYKVKDKSLEKAQEF